MKVHVLHKVHSGTLQVTHVNHVLQKLHILIQFYTNAEYAHKNKAGTQIYESAKMENNVELDIIGIQIYKNVFPKIAILTLYVLQTNLIGMKILFHVTHVQKVNPFMIFNRKNADPADKINHSKSIQTNVYQRNKMQTVRKTNSTTKSQRNVKREGLHQCALLQVHFGILKTSNANNVQWINLYLMQIQNNANNVCKAKFGQINFLPVLMNVNRETLGTSSTKSA